MSGGGGGGGGDENEHDDDDDDEDEDEDEGSVNPAALQAMLQEELKMVLIVNMQLKMGKGKIAAQCAHAAVGVLTRLQNVNSPIARQILMAYQGHGQPKITLQAPDLATLRTLEAQARERGMPTYLVSDAGRTQIAAGSKTVLAIGPAPRTLVDQVAGDLKLL
jgi:peptidyl-tRNA hydrolase, PTH2 family